MSESKYDNHVVIYTIPKEMKNNKPFFVLNIWKDGPSLVQLSSEKMLKQGQKVEVTLPLPVLESPEKQIQVYEDIDELVQTNPNASLSDLTKYLESSKGYTVSEVIDWEYNPEVAKRQHDELADLFLHEERQIN